MSRWFSEIARLLGFAFCVGILAVFCLVVALAAVTVNTLRESVYQQGQWEQSEDTQIAIACMANRRDEA